MKIVSFSDMPRPTHILWKEWGNFSIQNTHKVCIEFAEVGDKIGEQQVSLTQKLQGLSVCGGNYEYEASVTRYITEFRADVIVNAANEELKHIEGVADSSMKKGSQVIQQESDQYVRSHGSLKLGEIWLSHVVGNFPVLH